MAKKTADSSEVKITAQTPPVAEPERTAQVDGKKQSRAEIIESVMSRTRVGLNELLEAGFILPEMAEFAAAQMRAVEELAKVSLISLPELIVLTNRALYLIRTAQGAVKQGRGELDEEVKEYREDIRKDYVEVISQLARKRGAHTATP
jgi:hypothetical protein